VTFLDRAAWPGRVYSDGWVSPAGGEAAVTETRWVTMRRDIAPYPF
jgi:hypothetical protein